MVHLFFTLSFGTFSRKAKFTVCQEPFYDALATKAYGVGPYHPIFAFKFIVNPSTILRSAVFPVFAVLEAVLPKFIISCLVCLREG